MSIRLADWQSDEGKTYPPDTFFRPLQNNPLAQRRRFGERGACVRLCLLQLSQVKIKTPQGSNGHLWMLEIMIELFITFFLSGHIQGCAKNSFSRKTASSPVREVSRIGPRTSREASNEAGGRTLRKETEDGSRRKTEDRQRTWRENRIPEPRSGLKQSLGAIDSFIPWYLSSVIVLCCDSEFISSFFSNYRLFRSSFGTDVITTTFSIDWHSEKWKRGWSTSF